MKTRKIHIALSRLLLICFIAGQFMVYGHQHAVYLTPVKAQLVTKNLHGEKVTEKCTLCDVMHHNAMVMGSNVFANPDLAYKHVFEVCKYTFKSFSLILSCGRAPPVANYSV